MSFSPDYTAVPAGYRALDRGEIVRSTDLVPSGLDGWRVRNPQNANIGKPYDPLSMDTTIRLAQSKTLVDLFKDLDQAPETVDWYKQPAAPQSTPAPAGATTNDKPESPTVKPPAGYRLLEEGEAILITDKYIDYTGCWSQRPASSQTIGAKFDPAFHNPTARLFFTGPVAAHAETQCQNNCGDCTATESELGDIALDIPAGYRELRDGEKFAAMDLTWTTGDLSAPGYWRTFPVTNMAYDPWQHETTIRAIGNPIPTFDADLVSIDNALDACRELVSVVLGQARDRVKGGTV
jgi:hypothetical protein